MFSPYFENGVWLYKHDVLTEIKEDITATMKQSIEMTEKNIKNTVPKRIIRSLVRIFSPML